MSDQDSDREARRQEMLNNARGFLNDSMSDLWWTFLVRGILGVIVGLLALFWPTTSVSILLRIVGIFLIVDGAFSLFGYRNRQGVGSESTSGIVSLLIGAVLLFLPGTSAKVVFILLGIWALLRAAGYFYSWRQMHEADPERPTVRNISIVTLLVGVILIVWPATGLITIGWLLAFAAFVFASVMLVLAIRVKRLHDRVQMKTGQESD